MTVPDMVGVRQCADVEDGRKLSVRLGEMATRWVEPETTPGINVAAGPR